MIYRTYGKERHLLICECRVWMHDNLSNVIETIDDMNL